MKNLFIAFIFAALFLSACKDEDDGTVNSNPFMKKGNGSLNVAHRGGKGLYPENTLVAFDSATILGIDVLEMDVCLTKDSILVTNHDLTIDETCDTVGNVIDFTYAELQAFNFGYRFEASDGSFPYRANPVRIPKIEDVLAAHQDEYMVIEIKDNNENGKYAAEKLLALIRTYNMTKHVAVFSFSNGVMTYLHSINTDDVFTGAALTDALTFVAAVRTNPDTILTVRPDVFALPAELAGTDFTSEDIINAAHRNNVAIHYWTINDKDEMKVLIQKGADGVMTDRPDLMQEALNELGIKLLTGRRQGLLLASF